MKKRPEQMTAATCLLLCLIWMCTGGCKPLAMHRDALAPSVVMVRVPDDQYPDFTDDIDFDGVEYAIGQSLAWLQTLPPDRAFYFGNDVYDTGHMISSLNRFLDYVRHRTDKGDLQRFICDHYRLYRSVGDDGSGRVLFTGYYEPVLRGSIEKNARFSVPVYGRPRDLLSIDLSLFSDRFKGERIIGRLSGQTVVPYHDRSEIDGNGVLDGKADILAWLEDPIDLFFLQVQGSGKIILNDGSVLHAHYHASNGRPYRSIGRLLIENGRIPRSRMSMQAIRTYLKDHPDELHDVLNYNPSYVFFRAEPSGPTGSLNVPLTPGRSVALDRRIFPPAALAYVHTRKPLVDGNRRIAKWMDFTRFVFHQDTGGAIQGPGRADMFWGDGSYAEIASGHMQHPGSLYFLVLKPSDMPSGLDKSEM